MAEKSDGESDDIREQIRLLEKKKMNLETKITEKELSEKRNRERQLLHQKLRDLQGDVTALQTESNNSDDTSFLSYEVNKRPLSRTPGAGTSYGRKSQNNLLEESSDDDADDMMSKRHKQAIQMNRDVLVESMISDDIFNDLIAKKILTTADVGRIKEKNTSEAINEELLNNLVRRSDRAFYVFVRSLRRTLQEHLANRIDPTASAKKKRKRQTGELNVNVDVDEVTPITKRQQTCSCQEVEEQILVMAKTAYRNIRRRDNTPASFQQFQKELRETNLVIKDSMEVMHTLKILCRHGEMTDISHGSIRFTLLCTSVFVAKELWRKYVSGELLTMCQEGLVTADLRRRCRAKSIRLRVRIARDEYRQCLRELDGKTPVRLTVNVAPLKKVSSRCLRSRKLALKSENSTPQKHVSFLTSASPRRAFKEIQQNQMTVIPNVSEQTTKGLSYDLRNRSHGFRFRY